jgi:molybdate transport system permease protein
MQIFKFSPEELSVIALTVRVALVSTVLTLPFAVWIGWVLARKKFPAKSLVESLISIPLVAPPVVTGFILLFLFGRNGVIGSFLYKEMGIDIAFNFIALIIASVVVSLPLAVRSIKSAFELVDPTFEQAARTLGANRVSSFMRISLPLALPGIISGMVLSFARSLGEFGATISFAGNIEGKTQTIALMVYSKMQTPGEDWGVFRLVVISLLLSVVAISLSEYFNRKKKYLSQ